MNVRNALAFYAFYAIEAAWFPLVVIAYVIFVIRMIVYSRRTGVSATVLASFYPRWMMHQLRTRRDAPCARLMAVLPNISQFGLRLLTTPTLVAHRLTGHIPKIYRYPFPGEPSMNDQPAARTTFYDAALARHLPHVEQLVILGAGLDTRSYRLSADAPIRCFEVDTPRTQPFKRAMLQRASIDASRVTFVPADFAREDWFAKLTAAGFYPNLPTMFLWESVTMYLDRAAVEGTLRTIAGTAPGSVVAFDYFSVEQIANRSPLWRYARAIVKAVGEPFGTFGLDTTPPAREPAAAFVASCGLRLEEHRNFGHETGGQHPLAGFVTAAVLNTGR